MRLKLVPRALKETNLHHIQKLAALDQKSTVHPWTMGAFSKKLSKPRVYGVGVFDQNETLRGYTIYDAATPNELSVVSLLVDIECRRIGIGSGLLDCVRAAMNSIGVTSKFTCYVSEENDDAARFLTSYSKSRQLNLRTSLIRGEPRDCYHFAFREVLEGACV